ncbi:unnamed protein product, partial [Soboliphyme baturini]|uniref:DUF5110 domain-containing protein n=1 Tax=Soboliphyme baturini TaxID=241478 RepID=A0A183IXB0_9BILA
MNEPAANFPYRDNDQQENDKTKPQPCPYHKYDDPSYATQAVYMYGDKARLSGKTICMATMQATFHHYNVHNMYGMKMSQSTAEIKSNGEDGEDLVPLIISQSTFPSSGRFAGHWLESTYAKWTDLKGSIIDVLEFNLFGIPYVGPDMCTLSGDMQEELCVRWLQLGAFFPLARIRSERGEFSKYLMKWSRAGQVARDSLLLRYTYLPYIYTQFYRAKYFHEPVIRPLFYEFPHDDETYSIDKQFMIGSGLLVTPILEPLTDTPSGYFPRSIWYNIYDEQAIGKRVLPSYQDVEVCPDGTVAIHARGGIVYPRQKPALTITESRKNPLSLLIAVNESMQSTGELFWVGDNETLANNSKCYALYAFYYTFYGKHHTLIITAQRP